MLVKKLPTTRLTLLTLAVSVASALVAAENTTTRSSTPADVTPATTTEDGVRSITLPTIAFDLPDAPGKNLIVGNCMICHSPSYITMQPPLSRKTWEANVVKMRTTFGAPIPETLVPEIVDYLVKIRGLPEPATRPSK
jgi:sulfite dehydrogenase (cytochrome) subunit B